MALPTAAPAQTILPAVPMNPWSRPAFDFSFGHYGPSVAASAAMTTLAGDGAYQTFIELWRFYLDTGFIYPAKMDLIRPYLAEIFDTGVRLAACGEDIGKTCLAHDRGAIMNSLVLTRFYPHTWLIHHMASRQNPAGMVTLLLRNVAWLLDKPEVKYARFYWRPENKRVNALFRGLQRSFHKGGAEISLLKTLAYHHLNIPAVMARLDPAEPTISVSPVTPMSHLEISARLKQGLGQADYEVEALAPRTLTLSGLDDLYRGHGLERTRTLFAARRAGKLLGIALAENSSLGLNLSFYLNTFKIVMVETGLSAADKRAVVHGLLREVCRYYRRQGRDFVVALADPTLDAHLTELGFSSVKQYNCLSLSKTPDRDTALRFISRYYQRKTRTPKVQNALQAGMRMVTGAGTGGQAEVVGVKEMEEAVKVGRLSWGGDSTEKTGRLP
ncbi:MAG: hypothetical protein KJ621_03125 [Proteobacteria bacterium]|nr:hypothetical protein [Pseudomonadota bacterium]MBU1740770.1 hypothetical protein [Pseudomonadota bacterium]